MKFTAIQKPNILTRLITSKFLLPVVLFILGFSALMMSTPFAKATSTGIEQTGCINCAPALITSYSVSDIAIDSDGNSYTVDGDNNFVHKIDSSGYTVKRWGSSEFSSYGGSAIAGGNGEFAYPGGIATDSNNNVYVSDTNNNRIQKFDSNGNFITKWGSSSVGSYGGSAESTANGEFAYPHGIAISNNGDIYVADTSNNRIQKFDSSGNFIAKWGSQGSGDGELYYPEKLYVSSSGDVYVADAGNNRIQKFDSSGNFIAKWGSLGTGDGEFNNPRGIVGDGNGNIYVADNYNNRIQKFDSSGNFIAKWGSLGTGDGELNYPMSIKIDTSGKLYVVDQSPRISKFNSNGDFEQIIGSSITASMGGENGEFNFPVSSATDSDGNIYVTDGYNNRIQKFDSSGNYIAKWGSNNIGPYGGSDPGSGNGEFYFPAGIAVDTNNNVYVTDYYNNRIQKFDSSGNFIAKWGSGDVGPYGGSATSSENGEFNSPMGIVVDSEDNIYVADSENNRVQKLDSDGNYITKFGSTFDSYGSGNGQLNHPYDIDIDVNGNIYVVDSGNNRIQKFDSSGNYLAKWGGGSGGSYGADTNGLFNVPTSITIDKKSNVYVSDGNNNRIQKFSSAGAFVSQYRGNISTNAYPIISPYGIHSTGNGRLYVAAASSALLFLCDHDESNNNCVGAEAPTSTEVTVPNAVNSKPVTLSQTGCGSITNSSSQAVTALTKQDGSNTFPVGLVSYTLAGCSNGGSSSVTATFAGLTSTNGLKLRKYNSVTQKYMDVTGAELSTTTLSGQPAVKAVYSLTDGGPLDQDGQANGAIVDPVGLALIPASSGTLQNTGVVTISVTFLLFVMTISAIYIYRDYRKHKKPLQAIDPKVRYSFGHHIKVVTFPLLRYRIQFSVQKVIPGKNIHKF